MLIIACTMLFYRASKDEERSTKFSHFCTLVCRRAGVGGTDICLENIEYIISNIENTFNYAS